VSFVLVSPALLSEPLSVPVEPPSVPVVVAVSSVVLLPDSSAVSLVDIVVVALVVAVTLADPLSLPESSAVADAVWVSLPVSSSSSSPQPIATAHVIDRTVVPNRSPFIV